MAIDAHAAIVQTLLKDDLVLAPSARLETFELQGRFVLFHKDLQQLVELNDSARELWRALENQSSRLELRELWRVRSADADHGLQILDDTLTEWLRAGWIEPAELAARLDDEIAPYAQLSILGVDFEIYVHGGVPTGLEDLVRSLRGAGTAGHRIDVATWGEAYFLRTEAGSTRLYSAEEVVPAIKAVLVQRFAQSWRPGFLAHGALLDGQPGRVFLAGAPGAGKSTLAVALSQQGFQCLSDDIVVIDQAAQASGAPFPATLKRGAWPLLAQSLEQIDRLPIHVRSDDHQVRYLDVIAAGVAKPIDHFVILERQAEAPDSLTAIAQLDALSALLRDASSPQHSLSTSQVRALARRFALTQCWRLRYRDLAGALRALEGLSC